ncbi:MAG TPA: hypothetical protein PK156_01130 [Polyangium sp.]|nr:hypothetical protein [Polyangium sp.]
MQHQSFDAICHLPWRTPRQTNRRILILPDGNGRIATNHEGYAAGADNVVACAETLARRGDIETLVMCIVSDLNAQKRDERFFQVVTGQFSRLLTNIATKGSLIRADVRCRALGNLEGMRAMGGAREALVNEAEAVCEATNSVLRPRLFLEFWFAYSADIAWQTDIDLVVRTGAEEADVGRPGLSLPPNALFTALQDLWPEANPNTIGERIDYNLRHHMPQFGPGYALDFLDELLGAFPKCQVPAPARLTLPMCAPDADILALLKRHYADPEKSPHIATHFESSAGCISFGPTDDVWYALRLVPAARWTEFSSVPYAAIITPGQHAESLRFAMPTGPAHVHSSVTTAEGVLDALGRAVRFPVKHVLLHGADRSKANELVVKSPWPADFLELMHEFARHPQMSAEEFVAARLATNADVATERELLIQSISAKVLGKALAQGLLLADEPVRQSDRNYAFTGAFMMLRIADEGNPGGLAWERSAEMAIRCMLAISAGDNGVFDRMYPGESADEWRERLDSSAQYLGTIADNNEPREPSVIRGGRLVRVIGEQWQDMLRLQAHTSCELVEACRDALRRHYLANQRERAEDVVENPLVHWLCLGGLPRREACKEIEQRYAATTPGPVGQRIRALLETNVGEPNRFQAVRREMKLLLHLADTAHSIAVEVLFLFSALTLPKESVTHERLQTLIEVGRLADYAFRLANDLSSLNDARGGDQDPTKESSLSILIPKISSVSERAEHLRLARELGGTILRWLEQQLGAAMQHLASLWPSMAIKVRRAVQVGRGVYEISHYTTMTSDEILTLLRGLDAETHRAQSKADRGVQPSVSVVNISNATKILPAMMGHV